MSKNENYVRKLGRVLYVDPNDVNGTINGVPMTPDYSDLCISFKLECRVTPRFKQNKAIAETLVTKENKDSKEQETIKYSLNWNTPYGTIGKNQWVSFMQGDLYNNGNDSSLTTYYTDINYADYNKETILEGLGIDEVTIAYENYYTPTISIKFVDHRGSALFGREEVTHYDNKITLDSIFGAFFTAPYPLFRMQVKGFYGKAVTYQLTCTGFKGSLNPQTGNFEAIATFVGYSYSLLTDIPFEYLVAAPYCKYVGEDYWLAHCDQPEWRMEGAVEGDKVPTLFQLFQNINKAFTKKELLESISKEEKQFLDKSHDELNVLYSLDSIYTTLFDEIKYRMLGSGKAINEHIIVNNKEGENRQCLYMVTESADKTWADIKTMWETLGTSVKSYNTLMGDGELKITDDMLPQMPPFDLFNSVNLFNIDKKNGSVSLVGVKEETVIELSKLKINSVQLNASLCEEILKAIKLPDASNKLRPNVYLINWGKIKEFVDNRISEIKTKNTEINRNAERNYLYLAMDNLGIIPYVGNIFKLVICHVETFVHMMNQCYININNAEMVGQRTAEYLGISKTFTDVISNNTNIPPWPSITKSNDTTNYYLMTEREDTFGWIGDFSDYFEEAKLVRALYLACKRTSADPAKLSENEPIEYLYAPILPNDLNNNLNPFFNGGETLSALGGMLGVRLAQIFGIGERNKINDDIAKTLGKIDTLNYYRFISDRSKIDDLLSQCDNDIDDILYSIMLCVPSADKYGKIENEIATHDFEFTTGIFPDITRHQMFVDVGEDTLIYTYMPSKSHYGIVPANTCSFESYKKRLVGTRETGHYFEYDYAEQPFLHYCSTDQLFADYSNGKSKKDYVNQELYTVVIDTPTINGIFKRYEELKGNKISAMGEEYDIDTSKALKHYWAVTDTDFNSHLLKCNGFFCKQYKDIGIEDKMLLGDNFDMSTDFYDAFTKFRTLKFAHFNGASLAFDDGNAVKPSDLIIPTVDCNVAGMWYSLFGVDFYYMQNEISDSEVRNKVKALLFLHSLFYNIEQPMAWDDRARKSAAIRRIPFGKAALYGALVWRHEYIEQYNHDPIIYGDKYKAAYSNGVEYSLFYSENNEHWMMRPKLTSESGYTYRIFSDGDDKRCVFRHMPDYFVANELKRVFEYFLKNQWKTICNLELRKNDGSSFTTGKMFSDFINSIVDERGANLLGKEAGTLEYIKTWGEYLSNSAKKFASFTNNYSFFVPYIEAHQKDMLLMWLNPNNTQMQDALRSTYLSNCIELVTTFAPYLKSNSTVEKYGDIKLSKSNVKSYLSGFTEQLGKIKDKITNDIGLTAQDKQIIQDTPEFNRNTALPIYMYLKALWDKWLVSMDLSNHEFMVKNFHNCFLFFDSFYRNIESRFMLNCQLLLDTYNEVGTNTDITAFKFMADVVNKHHLMFVGLPCFESAMVTKGAAIPKEALEAMKTIFTPVQYSQMNPIDETNKFAVIYIPGLSEIPSELNGFKNDSFDIVGTIDGKETELPPTFPEVLRDDFILEDNSAYGLYMDYGYYVPSFGLAYGSQNNHMFKNINLSMETPIITSTVINTLSHTSRIGASNTHRIAFIGQDLFPVFSNYSYICEFEMMGCAQIQPLMYFQLMNVPMWRGTYIIFSVVHTMKPGDMTTKVKAMKLSCRVVPYSNAWFTENPNFDKNELRVLECLEALASGKYQALISSGVGSNITPTTDNNTPLGSAGIFSGKSMKEQLALCGITSTSMTGSQIEPLITWVEYKSGIGGKTLRKVQLNKHCAEDIKAIAEEVAALGWFDFYISSAWRKSNNAYGHRLGVAVDINCPDGGAIPNPWFNHHFCVNDPEPEKGKKLGYKMKKYSEPSHGYDKTKCIWYFNHPVAKIFRAHGWNWGGQFGDVMHFDLRGQDCADGKNTESRANGGPCPSSWHC